MKNGYTNSSSRVMLLGVDTILKGAPCGTYLWQKLDNVIYSGDKSLEYIIKLIIQSVN